LYLANIIYAILERGESEMRTQLIPDDVIEAILKKVDIVEIVGRMVKLTKRGRNFVGLCPFHSEKTPSFHVLPEKQIYHCFGCGSGGNIIRYVMNLDGIPFPEAVHRLAEESGIILSVNSAPAEMSAEQQQFANLIAIHEESAKFYHYVLNSTEQGTVAYQYLKQRGFSQKLIDEFQLGYAPPLWDALTQYLLKRGFTTELLEKAGLSIPRTESEGVYDRFRDRIMFPIRDANGKGIAFGGRTITNIQPKYLNSPDSPTFHKNQILYPLHQTKTSIRKKRQAILFEGYIDVLKAWDAGIDNGLATLGTALTESHIDLLRRYCEKVIICYDGDRAGQAATYKSLLLCEKHGLVADVATLPDGIDPDQFITKHGSDRFRTEVIEQAISATKFKIYYLNKDQQVHDERSKLGFVRTALEVIAPLDSPTEREHYVRELAAETGYSLDTLKQELQTIRLKVMKNMDNNVIPWNNDMNKHGRTSPLPALRPAYYNAERQLLAAMMHNQEALRLVQDLIGEQFHVEAHAALAAFLYAYYAEERPALANGFISSLHDDQLEATASSVLLQYPQETFNEQVLNDCIHELQKHQLEIQIHELKQNQQQLIRSQQPEHIHRAANLGNNIINLEKKLKLLSQKI
jgi:DNA primase